MTLGRCPLSTFCSESITHPYPHFINQYVSKRSRVRVHVLCPVPCLHTDARAGCYSLSVMHSPSRISIFFHVSDHTLYDTPNPEQVWAEPHLRVPIHSRGLPRAPHSPAEPHHRGWPHARDGWDAKHLCDCRAGPVLECGAVRQHAGRGITPYPKTIKPSKP